MEIEASQKPKALIALTILTLTTVIVWPLFVILEILIPQDPTVEFASLTLDGFSNVGYLAFLCLVPLTILSWFVYLGFVRSRDRKIKLLPVVGWSAVGAVAALFGYYVFQILSFFLFLPLANSLTH